MNAAPVPNTLGVECVADDIRFVADEDTLAEQISEVASRSIPLTVVGGGSNLVLRARLPGVVVVMRLKGMTVERLDAGSWRVTAGAGVGWQDLVDATVQRGIGGLENLTLIPGSVGAAPVQNIGAYGRELSQVLESVRVFDRERGNFETLTDTDCLFGYRNSRFKRDAQERYVITRVALRLGGTALAADYPDIARELACTTVTRQTIAHAVATVRRRKLPDPTRIGNVGSFFKNPVVSQGLLDRIRALIDIDDYPAPVDTTSLGASPVGVRRKIPAARLIDRAGWKGVRQGPVEVWRRQPLVLVNRGGATGRQVLELAERIRDDVYRRYGVALELEPRVKGVD